MSGRTDRPSFGPGSVDLRVRRRVGRARQPGGHVNPAVTLAFARRGDFKWHRIPGYWIEQVAGATAAALLLRYLLGSIAHLRASKTELSDTKTLIVEAVPTAVLVTVVLNTASRHSLIGTDSAIAVGATIARCGTFAGTPTGGSMNPARSFRPGVVSAARGTTWLYLVGPFAGARVAVALAMALHHDREERKSRRR